MKQLAAVAIVFGSMILVRRIGQASTVDAEDVSLVLGFMLIVALVSGEFLRRFRLPRLTGYLLFGLLIGPHLGNVVTESMARQLLVVNGVATTLIAFIAGLTLNVERLERSVTGVGRATALTLAIAMVGAAALAWIGWPWLPIAPEASGGARLSMVALLAVILISFSPTMTAAVIAETRARGKLSDFVLATVVLADLIVLVLFSVWMQVARGTLGVSAPGDVDMSIRLAWEIGGAIAFGSLVGAMFALYLRYVAREQTLVLLLMCLVLSQTGVSQRVEPLLAALTAGVVIANVAVDQGDTLKAAIQSGALPLLVVFFVSIGASLRLDALTMAWFLVPAVAAVRIGLIWCGVQIGLKVLNFRDRAGRYVWTGLISQAGITLGLASVLASEFPTWGARIQMLLVAVIAIDELIGPALFRTGLARTGEIDRTAERPLLVVSNREPYLHNFDSDGAVICERASGGVAVALDALMRERGGTWIAHGAGSADRDVVDRVDHVMVPPDAAAYTLRRLWIASHDFSGYYRGFANEGLWPLCHLVDVRPKFRSEDWQAYKRVNAQFAAAIDEEIPARDTPVFIQDYHLAMTAAYLRQRRPAVRTALFWHIPWPNPDRLLMCQYRHDLIAGLLANDLLAFQVDRDRRNFIRAAEEDLGAEIEAGGTRVLYRGRHTAIVSVPIGVDYDRIQGVVGDVSSLSERQQRLRERFGLPRHAIIAVGVDRLDYTKGIPERIAAIDQVLTRRPDLRGQLRFVQIGVPSRSELQSYEAIESEIDWQIKKVNIRHRQHGSIPPIYYHKGALDLADLVALYRMADVCVVSSLADGMNLVAKEFVAARDDEDGVLVLSALAGASEELREALIINPYDVEDFTSALTRALEMEAEERQLRMRAMRRTVAGRDVFSWASDILEGLESLWTKPLQYAARAPEDAPV